MCQEVNFEFTNKHSIYVSLAAFKSVCGLIQIQIEARNT